MNNQFQSDSPTRLHQEYYRNGQNHRAGADVSFNDIKKLFNFRRITIGSWVTKEEQQIAANLFFDALYDLIDILQVNEKVISLNGSLSIAFGTGGEIHTSAHYDANKRQLALAKNAGGGALAHEWFHAFDHYICSHLFVDQPSDRFASAAWLENATLISHPLNHILNDFFETLFIDPITSEPNQLVEQSIKADKALKAYYFAMPQEMAARAFEACVQDHKIKNTFLVKGTKMSTEARLGIYPRGTLRVQLHEILLLYFTQLGEAIIKNKFD